jgi:flagellar P-ring protein FlgI
MRNEAAIRALANRLQGLGFTVSTDEIMARNVAVVMVTSEMPSYARPGHRLDVTVSSSGDATNLAGGVLQFTPLYAPNGDVFATAQGSLTTGAFRVQAAGSAVQRNHPTTGRVAQGAIVERDNPNRVNLSTLVKLDWIVNEPDFTTASRLADAINTVFDEDLANPQDSAVVNVAVPQRYRDRVVEMVAEIERIDVDVDRRARVVVNERTGTVVMGADVQISPVAVAHGGLTIEVQADNAVSQPGALATGQTTAVANAAVSVDEEKSQLTMIGGASVGELVAALNDIGVKPRDLIQILQAVHSAGALHAEVVVQ